MRKNKCNILLILDNVPYHKVYTMSNVNIAFLTADLTGVLTTFGCGYNTVIQSSLSEASTPPYH